MEPAEDIKAKYLRGEEIEGARLAPGGYAKGDWLVFNEGIYYKNSIQVAGKVRKEEIESGERELQIELAGTKSEDLLKLPQATVPRLLVCICAKRDASKQEISRT